MTYALRNDPANWVIYAEPLALKPFTLQLNLPKGNYRAEWTDVMTGAVLKAELVALGGLLTPPISKRNVVVRGRGGKAWCVRVSTTHSNTCTHQAFI